MKYCSFEMYCMTIVFNLLDMGWGVVSEKHWLPVKTAVTWEKKPYCTGKSVTYCFGNRTTPEGLLEPWKTSIMEEFFWRETIDYVCKRARSWIFDSVLKPPPANTYLFKDNNRNNRKRHKTCPKSTIKTPERHHWRSSGTFLLVLNVFHTFCSRFYCWLWTIKRYLGLEITKRAEQQVNKCSKLKIKTQY